MDLLKLKNILHAATAEDWASNKSVWLSQISDLVSAGTEEEVAYFINHTGRELFTKAENLNDPFESDTTGSGNRPKPIKYDNETISKSLDIKQNPGKSKNKNKKSALKGDIISWYDALDSSSYELDGEFINSVKDKSGSYDLSSLTSAGRPTLQALTFPDGKSRNTFYFPPGVVGGEPAPNSSGTTLRSYNFTHDFASDGELNLAIVVNFVPSGTTDPQDFVFEAANDANTRSSMGRLFVRKLNEKEGTQTPRMSGSGGGGALNVLQSDTGYNFFNPITILFNIHLSKGLQISRYNGIEVKRSTINSLTNIEYVDLDSSLGRKGGGIWYGSNWWGESQLEGGLGEIILYNDSKDSPVIETYLSNKWGISIPSKKRFLSF